MESCNRFRNWILLHPKGKRALDGMCRWRRAEDWELTIFPSFVHEKITHRATMQTRIPILFSRHCCCSIISSQHFFLQFQLHAPFISFYLLLSLSSEHKILKIISREPFSSSRTLTLASFVMVFGGKLFNPNFLRCVRCEEEIYL